MEVLYCWRCKREVLDETEWDAFVPVPTARALPVGLTLRFSPDSAVELRALDTALRLDGHVFVADNVDRSLAVRDSGRPSHEALGAVCEVIDAEGGHSPPRATQRWSQSRAASTCSSTQP